MSHAARAAAAPTAPARARGATVLALVAAVDEEGHAVDEDLLAHREVRLRVVVHARRVHLARAVDELRRVRRRRVRPDERVEVLCELALAQKGGKGVAPAVGALDLEDLGLVVLQVEVQREGAQLAVDAAAVVPRQMKAQHLRSAERRGRRGARRARGGPASGGLWRRAHGAGCGAGLRLTCRSCRRNLPSRSPPSMALLAPRRASMNRIRSSSDARGWKYFWLRALCSRRLVRCALYGSTGVGSAGASVRPSSCSRKSRVNPSASVTRKVRPYRVTSLPTARSDIPTNEPGGGEEGEAGAAGDS